MHFAQANIGVGHTTGLLCTFNVYWKASSTCDGAKTNTRLTNHVQVLQFAKPLPVCNLVKINISPL